MTPAEAAAVLVNGSIAAGFGASVALWVVIIRRQLAGRPVLSAVTPSERRRPGWAVLGAVGWIAFMVVNRLAIDLSGQRPEAGPGHLWVNLAIAAGVFGVLTLMLFGERRFSPTDAGMRPTALTIPLGVGTFIAAIAPTLLLRVATLPFYAPAKQHPLLQLLGQSPDIVTRCGLAFTVIVVAPLAEELLFRVTLQGGLAERFGSAIAVPVTAVVFALIHGWLDGLALIPLALLLGHLYDRRQDFFAVVITHGLFNGANLMLGLLTLWSRPPQ